MRRTPILACAATFLFAAGCATCEPASSGEIAKEDFGDKPADPHQLMTNYFSRILFDASTAEYKFENDPVQGKAWVGGRDIYGWLYTVDVNSTNNFGARTGWKTWKFLIRDNAIQAVKEPSK
jgi:hypothetical protein